MYHENNTDSFSQKYQHHPSNTWGEALNGNLTQSTCTGNIESANAMQCSDTLDGGIEFKGSFFFLPFLPPFPPFHVLGKTGARGNKAGAGRTLLTWVRQVEEN